MEVVIPTRPTMDFDFNSARASPAITAPSTPRRFGDYNFLSAPTSPSRISEFYRDFDEFNAIGNWEQHEEHDDFAANPKSPKLSNQPKFEDDFAFDVSDEVERTSLSAEELFHGGILRPFTPPPPPRQVGRKVAKPTTPKSPSFLRQVISPRRSKRDKDHHSFGSSSTRIETTRNVSGADQYQTRGRDKAPPTLSSSISGRRAARSLSPSRVSEYQWEEDEPIQQQAVSQRQNNKQVVPKAAPLSVATSCNPTSSKASWSSARKWRLKDFLLFRSASEGRATDKDPFRKYAMMFRKSEEMKNASSSFRSIDSPASGSNSRRRGPVSAHELHYTVNKAVSEDMKKKTFLPYKQGILGRLAFNPAVSALANGFGSFSRSSKI